MITNKSKIKYEVILTLKEFEAFKEKYFKNNYESYSVNEGILLNPKNLRYHIFFTRKQYELFKRLWNETKNKK